MACLYLFACHDVGQISNEEKSLDFLTAKLDQRMSEVKTLIYTAQITEECPNPETLDLTPMIPKATLEAVESKTGFNLAKIELPERITTTIYTIIRGKAINLDSMEERSYKSGKPNEMTCARYISTKEMTLQWETSGDTPDGVGSVAQKWEHDQSGKPPRQVDILLQIQREIDLLKVAYGLGRHTFLELMAMDSRTGNRWTVQVIESGSGHKSVYHVQIRRRMKLVVDCVVDPNVGYLVTSKRVFHDNGSLHTETLLTPREVSKGLWLPSVIEEKKYKSAENPESLGDLISTRLVQFSNVVVNEPLDKDAFTLQSLGLPEGNPVIYKSADGTLSSLRYKDGRLVSSGSSH